MKKNLLIALITLIFVSARYAQPAGQEFKQVNQWNHGDKEIYTQVIDPLIDNQGHIVALIGGSNSSNVIISPKDVIAFAPFGQGPSDLYLVLAQCHYKNDVAFLEYPAKIKIFTKKDNTYVWKETKWLKQSYYANIARDIIFINDKWFTGGYKRIKEGKQVEIASLVNIYDEIGKPVKELLRKEFPAGYRYTSMDYYLASYNDRVFFIAENELKVYEISALELEVKKEIPLSIPPFYKKMPEDFYKFKIYKEERGFSLAYEHWKTSYSYITRVAVEDGFLVIQIRTFGEKQKKFALLFYDIVDFNLKHTFAIDDYFLGTRKGIYYFYRSGDPGYDEGTNQCIINLYSFSGKK